MNSPQKHAHSGNIFGNVGTIMPVWLILRTEPGYISIIESHGRYKIGKTRHMNGRLKEAKTWLPDMYIIGIKQFWGVSYHERMLHIGFVRNWYAGEWFKFDDEPELLELLLDGFTEFTNDNPDKNSIDFIYWFNGDGMAELAMEMDRQKLSLPRFRKQESC